MTSAARTPDKVTTAFVSQAPDSVIELPLVKCGLDAGVVIVGAEGDDVSLVQT